MHRAFTFSSLLNNSRLEDPYRKEIMKNVWQLKEQIIDI
jgi:hypothetical protein